MKKIYLEKLPHSKSGKTIRWSKSIGEKVKFIYDDIEGIIEIIDYGNFLNSKLKCLKIKYNNNAYIISTQDFSLLKFSNIFAKEQTDFYTTETDNHRNDKYVNLSSLPVTYRGIDWNEAAKRKCILNFIYGDITGTLKILSYSHSYVDVEYCGKIYNMNIENIRNCALGKMLGFITSDHKFEVGTHIKDERRDYILTDMFIKHYKNYNRKFYKYRCNICGYVGEVCEGNIINLKYNCACCTGKVVVEGVNDIPTTDPWMIDYFQGEYDEAKKYTHGSSKKIYPKCPDCNTICSKKVSICSIYYSKNSFCNCGDGRSYPEKFVYNFLIQFISSNDIIAQYNHSHADWITNNYRYDYYIKNKNMIIEVHGNQHYSEKTFEYCGGKSLNLVQKTDMHKMTLAIDNKISYYIILDCRFSNVEWIKKSIINSKLLEIFNINKKDIDWDYCERNAHSNIVKQVCEYKTNNQDKNADDICAYFNISKTTLSRYLNIGDGLGWCSKEIFFKNEKPICFINKNLYFKNISQFCKQSEVILGYIIPKSTVRYCCNNKTTTRNGLSFKYVTYIDYFNNKK